MTIFNISNDDIAVRRLQETNKTPVVSAAVMPVKASNPVQKSPENKLLQSGQIDRRHGEPHQSQRRQLDRRKTDHSVLLDTRSQHDRRTKTGRSGDVDTNKKIIGLRGIDEII